MDIRHFQAYLPDSATFSADGILHIAGHSVPELAQTYGTPLYLFDKTTIVRACQMYTRAFREIYRASESLVLYASKAYLAPLVAYLVAEQGLGLDVVSGGELLLAQRARVPMERISFHGNNKSEEELRQALQAGVGRIVLDNWNELERLTHLARETGSRPGVLVRVAPEIKTNTHRYLQTGHASSKFGFHLLPYPQTDRRNGENLTPLLTSGDKGDFTRKTSNKASDFALGNGEAKAALLRIIQDDCLDLLGLHAHTGTMLRDARPYAESLERLLALAADVREETGWWPREISPGGGWGIDTPEAGATPDIAVLATALQESMVRGLAAVDADVAAPRLIVEPGRSIIARAGLAVYRVGARKATPGGITYLFVDGGMADNIRPALYGAIYTALPVERVLDEVQETVCISGRYCEAGDLLVEEVQLPQMSEGELLAMPTVGAYCLPMASNYNLVPRPIVLLIDEQSVQIMERRETHEDLFSRYTF